jgi:uncharacterized protein
MIKIDEEIYAIETSLYLKKTKTIVIADTHFGFEESLKNQGILLPKRQYNLMIEQLKRIISKTKAEKIILNGDIKHEFGKITKQEWNEINIFLEFCRQNFKETIIIKGNHDAILKNIIKKKNINEIKEYKSDGILITHGDNIPKKTEKTIIIGHEHPAIILENGSKKEKYKCFIKGKTKNKTIIAQPSFNPIIEGTNIIKKEKFSPLLPKNLENFEVFIYDEFGKKTLYFGKLKDIHLTKNY